MSADPPSSAVAVPKGYRVGPWEIREPIASGAFATVYAARRTGEGGRDLPAQAALKFLPTGTRTPRQLRHLRELAEREVKLLAKLRAARLIRMYDTLTVDAPDHPELDGATVLVLERAEGPLEALLEETPQPEGVLPALLAQVCEGLHQLHHAGWVHGDLKPANVLLMKDGSVRLADFNMAAELEGTHAYAPAFATRDYTPPELLWPEIDERGSRIRPSADIWAFGVLAHRALTGAFPFPGATAEARTDAATRYARGTEELRLSPQLPDGWRDIIRDCLAPTHPERPTAEALLRRVEQAAGATRSPRLPRLRPRFWQRHPILAATLTTLVLVTTVAGLAVHNHITAVDGTPVYARLPRAQAFPTGPDGQVIYGYHRCPDDSLCFFSEHNGNGEMCVWQDDDRDWQSGRVVCAWAAGAPIRSIFNNIDDSRTNSAVAYYRGPDFQPADADRRRTAQRTGCSAVNSMGNLAGTYAPRSHKLIDSCSSFTAVVDLLTPW